MSQTSPRFSPYDDTAAMQIRVRAGAHRSVVGGLWDELGALQLSFLRQQGLLPHHRLIDVGAGSFRAGVRLIPYLDPGRYYAIDLQSCLLEAGYTHEILPAGLDARFPRANFAATDAFDITGFGCQFAYGLAQSVFTHMPAHRIADCLAALAPAFVPGGRFFATVFLAPNQLAARPFQHRIGGITTTQARDPYHTTRAALDQLMARVTGWDLHIIGEWGHPRDQQMLCFTRRKEGLLF